MSNNTEEALYPTNPSTVIGVYTMYALYTLCIHNILLLIIVNLH